MKILVLGSSGFIGQNIVEQFEPMSGFELFAADIEPSKFVRAKKFYKTDVTVESELTKLCHELQPDIIINLAARTDLSGRSEADYYCNYKIVQNLVNILKIHNDAKLIHFSSMLADACFANLSNDMGVVRYGESKSHGEKILLNLDEDIRSRITVLRPTSIWGRYFHEPYINFFRSVKHQRYLNIGKRRYKSFGYVGSVITQVLQVINQWPEGRLYIVGDPEPYEIEEFSDQIADAFSVRRPRVVPRIVLLAISWGLSKVYVDTKNPLPKRRLNNLLNPIVYRPTDIEYAYLSEKEEIHKAIQDTVRWMKEQSNYVN